VIYLVALVVLVLATARVSRLAYFDDITIGMRASIDRRFGTGSFLSKMVWCPWCNSIWASMLFCPLVMTAAVLWGNWPIGAAIVATIVLVPAVAYPAGWLVDFETHRTSRGD
jgi:hypothetical protein